MQGMRGGGTGCIALALGLFFGLIVATAGTALYPPVAYPGAALLCGGEVRYESHGASYRPGEYTVTRQIYCETGSGKDAGSEEITFRAVGLSFLIYAAAFFLILRFLVGPMLRSRVQRTLGAAPGVKGAENLLAWLGQPKAVSDTPPGDLAERLERLKALRDQGLITAEDYEAKKAEILSRL